MDIVAPGSRLRWLGAGVAAGRVGAALITQVVFARPAAPAASPPVAADVEVDSLALPPLITAAPVDDVPADAVLGSVEPADILDDALDVPVAAPSRERLTQVPFRTQRDDSPYAGSNAQLDAAMGPTMEPRQAVAFS